jgi:hypothetical protein
MSRHFSALVRAGSSLERALDYGIDIERSP